MGLISGLLGFFRALLAVFRGRQEAEARAQDRTAGANAIAAKTNAEAINEIQKATAAGDAVERDLRAHPERVFDPDPDQRPD